MARSLRQQVWERARERCEYCQLPQALTVLPHKLDHIRARKHRGATNLLNTCVACAECNSSKSSNASGFDPETDELVPLFHPRRDRWDEHFVWQGPTLMGRTAVGRATIEVLNINHPDRVRTRALLIKAGLFPSP
jgi:hypothetical protein